jgi:hypothetical protein
MDTMKRLVEIANEKADGHLTIMKFTTNWRVGFFTPRDHDDIENLQAGKTFEEAANAAIAAAQR